MVHPILQIFIPDTLQASLIQYERQRGHRHGRQAFNLIGFTQRQSQNCPHLPDNEKDQKGHSSSQAQHLLLPDLVQVSLVALSSSYKAYESSAYHDDEVVGQVILDDEPLQPTPAWACSELSSLFVTLRLFSPSSPSSASSIRVERVVLDGLVLSPDPGVVILFHYSPSLLNQAHHLRHLHESESGLPPLLRAAFRPLPRDRNDLIPLQGREWPSSEVASDPFGLEFGDEIDSSTASWRDRVLSRSMGVKQINLRARLVLNLFHGKLSILAGLNLIALLTLDITLGVMLTTFLLTFFPALYATLHAQVHILLRLLLGLLEWLKGSPAGLKLNAELNSLLWRFFSYHLHLWANYIGILEPILSLILSTIIWIGPLSFTVQLSLMKDLISMATFHVYCLYIYATRLYHIFLIVITSLGRLFFGRKWNPLRNRVDHVHLSISEVFLGALFFTIAIFLSPTVIIYYAVFLSLRLTVLFLELSLSHFVATFNSIRPVSTLLILANSPRVCDQVYLERLLEPEDSSSSSFQHPPQFRIRLQATKSPFSLSPTSSDSDDGGGFSLFKTISYIIRGQVLNR